MLTWDRFRRSSPELAAAGRVLLYQNGVGLAFLGTVRDDGGPRVHPVSPILVEGGLFALMLVSPKLGDLVRDGRFAMHSFPAPARLPYDPVDDAFYLTGRVRFPEDVPLRRTVAAVFLAERGLHTPPPGFARQTLVEFLVESCVLSRAGRYATWPRSPATSDTPRTPTASSRSPYRASPPSFARTAPWRG
jgi:hypothetical protein